MARPGVTYQDIAAAANELKGQGKSVTIENVRSILKTGSIGTINNHLRKWKEAQNFSQKSTSKEDLPDELVSLVKGLWEGVVDQSNHRFEPVEENYQHEISELKLEVEKYRANNRRWQKLFNQWMQERVTLINENRALEQALEFTQKENAALLTKQDGFIQQLQEKQKRIEELHHLHKQAQENLEHNRMAAREQRIIDQQQFEQQKQQLQSELKLQQEQSIQQREKYSELQSQYQSLEINHSEEKLKYQQLRMQFEASEQSHRHWQNQCKEIQTSLEVKTSELITLQADMKVSSQQLAEAKQAVRDAEVQNKLLAEEKWILIQEKSRLENQLKHAQDSLVT